MEPCSPSVLSVGAANWSVYTPNVAVGDNSAVPQGGTWKYFSWGYDNAVNGVVAGGTNIPNSSLLSEYHKGKIWITNNHPPTVDDSYVHHEKRLSRIMFTLMPPSSQRNGTPCSPTPKLIRNA